VDILFIVRNVFLNMLDKYVFHNTSFVSMNFQQEFQRLITSSPQLCVNSGNVQNCPYGDYMFNCNDCYLCFETGGSDHGFYLDNCMKTQSCTDCSFTRYSELCYECMNVEKCYNCDFCVNCHNAHHLKHCFDCVSCNNCFGSVGLRHKEYYVYNQPYTKEEYEKKIQEPFDIVQYEKLNKEHPRPNLHLVHSEDCVGDYIHSGKSCYGCFDINNMENCMYYSSGNYNAVDKDCCDIDNGSGNELCYASYGLGYSYNCNFLVHSSRCRDSEFGWNLTNCNNCFGCVYLKDKEYYILNQPYSKEEYCNKTALLREELKQTGTYTFDLLVA